MEAGAPSPSGSARRQDFVHNVNHAVGPVHIGNGYPTCISGLAINPKGFAPNLCASACCLEVGTGFELLEHAKSIS